jgi:hypothetical protein
MMSQSGKFHTLTHIFENIFDQPLSWLTLILVTLQISVFELAFRAKNKVLYE